MKHFTDPGAHVQDGPGRTVRPANEWRRCSSRALVLLLLGAPVASACASAQWSELPPVPDAPPRGWTIPADSVRLLFHPHNLVIVHERTSGPYPSDLVILRFRPDATAADRSRAVAAVRGSVVGGNGVYYYLRVQATCTDRPVWCAIDLLEPLPQVADVHPYLYGAGPAGA